MSGIDTFIQRRSDKEFVAATILEGMAPSDLLVVENEWRAERSSVTLWKECEGKQVLNSIALAIGFSDARMLSSAAFALWERGTVPVPAELQSLRAYLSQL